MMEDIKKKQLKAKFREFIIEKDHPCIMAQTMFKTGHVDFHEYGDFGSREAALKILSDLESYIAEYDFGSNEFFTFIAAFPNQKNQSEKEFESILWQQLQWLHKADDAAWDKEVSPNPKNKNFSFSLLGKAFYLVGMHPNSSRKARQSPVPSVVFNLHGQFEHLRQIGVYRYIRDKIRQRDKQLQGSTNPMLEDFGNESEAKQYSGRKVGPDWKCPFHQ